MKLNKLDVLIVLVSVLLCEVCFALPSLIGTSFDVDIGSPNDFNSTQSSFCSLSVVSGSVSPPLLDSATGITYRTLTEYARLIVSCNISGFSVPISGVPYVDALLSVAYRDDIDESECSKTYYNCRDLLQVKIDRASALTWYSVRGLGGNKDGKWKNETVPLQSSPWQLLRSINGIIQFGIYNTKQPSFAVPLAIDKLSLRFVTNSELVSWRETWRLSNGLIRSEYLNGSTSNIPQRPTIGQSFSLFQRNYLEKIYQNTIPSSSEISNNGCQIEVTEIAGETEPASLCVFAFDSLSNVTLSVSGIHSDNIAMISVFEVLQEDRRWVFAYDKYYGLNPWSLKPLSFPLNNTLRQQGNWDNFWPKTLSVSSNTTKQFWLNIKVFKNAPEGIYSGKITVCANIGPSTTMNRVCQTASLLLHVIQLELGIPDAETYIYHSPFLKSIWGNDKGYVVDDQAAHGPLAPIVYARGNILKNGTVDFSLMIPEMEALKKAGILKISGKIRLLNSDNWRSVWQWTYGDKFYFLNRTETTEFDNKMKSVLSQYSDFCSRYGVSVDNSFEDEPGVDINRRLPANHLNRLAKEIGQSTWVTYYTNCERPLAGHDFTFKTLTNDLPERKNPIPEWILHDPELRIYYDFEQEHVLNTNVTDLSGRGNHGKLSSGAQVINGVLEVNETRYLYVNDNPSIDLPNGATILVSLRVDALNTGYASRFCTKWSGTLDANWCAYLFGNSGNGSLGMYITSALDGKWKGAPGQDYSLLMPVKSQWHQYLWTFDSSIGGQQYLDHIVGSGPISPGNMSVNNAGMVLGIITGGIDNFVLLGRGLTETEQLSLTEPSSDLKSSITLSLILPAATAITPLPTSIHFSVSDLDLSSKPANGAIKKLLVNGIELWNQIGQTLETEFFHVSISSALVTSFSNNLTFVMTNGRTGSEHLRLYFMESFWRNQNWVVGGKALGRTWSYSYTADPLGDFGPMHQWLDDAVSAMSYVGKDLFKHVSTDLGMKTSYYTTYPANCPVPLYNRFLSGIYPAAINAPSINVYAYSDWTADAWDEQFGRPSESFTGYSKFQSSYGLVQPSWDPMVYDCVVWETLREGIEDSRLIKLLKELISNDPSSEMAIEAQKLLDSFKSVNPNYGQVYHKTRNIEIQKRGDTSDLILKDLSGSETDFDFFDRTRLKMIEILTKSSSPSITSTQAAISASNTLDPVFISLFFVVVALVLV